MLCLNKRYAKMFSGHEMSKKCQRRQAKRGYNAESDGYLEEVMDQRYRRERKVYRPRENYDNWRPDPEVSVTLHAISPPPSIFLPGLMLN